MVFTPAKLKALRKAYLAASAASVEQFEFEGQVLVTGYAKYLLEYLDGVLGEYTGRRVKE